MSSSTSVASRLPIDAFAAQFQQEMLPLSNSFSYFAALPLDDTQTQQYVREPVSALPPAIADILPKLHFVLVPYLERTNGKESVTFEKPAENRHVVSTSVESGGDIFLFLAVKDEEVAEYHYTFYNSVAVLASRKLTDSQRERFSRLLREELANEAHGEVEEKSWRLKQQLLRRQTNLLRDTKLQREYFRQAFEDTATLYLHGLCCDIDVETGPRQLPTRYLRKRLELLRQLFPPPQGFALFPEELGRRE